MALVTREIDLPAEKVPSWIQNDRIIMSLALVGAAPLIYDLIITMDKEVHYFWDTKISFTKMVFLLNRYIGLVGAVLSLAGSASGWLQNVSYAITIISIDYILTIRVLALYQNEKRITVMLYAVLALEAIEKSVLVPLGTKLQPAVIVRLSSELTNCAYEEYVPQFIYIIDWTLPPAYGTLLLCLALFKGRQFWKLNGYNGSRLVMILIRDQALYFLLAIFSSVLAILGNEFPYSLVFGDILSTLGRPSFLSILGNRMFFNLKEAAEKGVNIGTNWTSYSHSAIHFDRPADSQQGSMLGGSMDVGDREGNTDLA